METRTFDGPTVEDESLCLDPKVLSKWSDRTTATRFVKGDPETKEDPTPDLIYY